MSQKEEEHKCMYEEADRGRSISGRPSSSENLGCEVVAGCCEMLQHRHGYHGSLITTPPGSG